MLRIHLFWLAGQSRKWMNLGPSTFSRECGILPQLQKLRKALDPQVSEWVGRSMRKLSLSCDQIPQYLKIPHISVHWQTLWWAEQDLQAIWTHPRVLKFKTLCFTLQWRLIETHSPTQVLTIQEHFWKWAKKIHWEIIYFKLYELLYYVLWSL